MKTNLKERAKRIAKTKQYVDDIVKTLTNEERNMLGTKDGEYLSMEAGECVVKRFMKFSEDIPVAFFDIFENDTYFDVAVATRNGQEYRNRHYAYSVAQLGIIWYNKHKNGFKNKPLIWMAKKTMFPQTALR